MNRIRNILSFLLIAGVACVHAQQPIVKINSDSLATECDVQAPAGAPIFQMDATGNVLVYGTLSGNGCGGVPGTNTATFGFNPPAANVSINGIVGAASVAAGSTGTVPFTYQAYNASQGCSVAAPTTSGSCPAVTASNGTCQGTGAQYSCAPTGATLSIPSAAQMGANPSCAYSVKATCMPGTVTSTAILTVTTTTGGGDPGCPAPPATIHSSSGASWTRVSPSTSVKYGDNVVANSVDATSYEAIWSYPGTNVAWPGNAGLTTRPTALGMQYFAEKFTVPSNFDTTQTPKWSWTGSGIGSNFSVTISKCAGDFGQTGTVLTAGCKLNQSQSSNGLTAHVNAAQQGNACTLTPGQSYYLNILPNASLPVSDVSTPSSPACSTCTPWAVRN